MSSRSLRIVSFRFVWLLSVFCIDLKMVSAVKFSPEGGTTDFIWDVEFDNRKRGGHKTSSQGDFKPPHCNALEGNHVAALRQISLSGYFHLFFKSLPDIPVLWTLFFHAVHCVTPWLEQSFSSGENSFPPWYHLQPILTGFGDPRTRRMTGITHAAIDSESSVVVQWRENLEWHSFVCRSH